jgi:hypothetical protein
MKVQNSSSASLSGLQNAGTVSSRGSPSPGLSPGDDVRISTLSRALTALDVGEHAVKVVHLSGAVASSSYQVDASALSATLIQEHMRAAA